jgi:hypothetical protein
MEVDKKTIFLSYVRHKNFILLPSSSKWLELITLGSPVIAEKSTNIHGINRRFR